MTLIATDGDTVTQEDAHDPPDGAGTYPMSPTTLQDFISIAGKLAIVDGQTYSAHGTATVNGSSTLVFIEGVAVALDGDSVSHHHSNSGVAVINQDFVSGV